MKKSMEIGKAYRNKVPRTTLSEMNKRNSDVDPISIFHYSSKDRLPSLFPVRAERMAESPFRFFRGVPELMLMDLIWTNQTGLLQQICGDAHLLNFRGFASRERTLLFGINDFDESMTGPFEWDIKRLATSIFIAGHVIGLDSASCSETVYSMLDSYINYLKKSLDLSPLEQWYRFYSAEDILDRIADDDLVNKKERMIAKELRKTPATLLEKMTVRNPGSPFSTFKEIKPLMWKPSGDDPFQHKVDEFFNNYRRTVSWNFRMLFDRYRFSDLTMRVVGVGSVGTRTALALFEDGEHDHPLILQMKEADASIFSNYFGNRFKHQGQRVIRGQTLMQSSSDIFLGWATDPTEGRHYYVRQFRDMKVKAEVEDMDASFLMAYAKSCGFALGDAHVRGGNAGMIMGYTGDGHSFKDAIVQFASAYAERNNKDYDLFLETYKKGKLMMD
ncbi:MAG TPA: DUF2252 domain-containing protein [Saprospiraceae bacterium]|nr:DUF2252 domain-containing protein [Saprospiraceae bacterium]